MTRQRTIIDSGLHRNAARVVLCAAIVMICPVSEDDSQLFADDTKFLAADVEFFEQQIRPLLLSKCVSCHGPDKAENELRLDSRASLLKGGARGPAAIAGDSTHSLLVRALKYTDESLQMPPGSRLSEAEQLAITAWIDRGLAWPDSGEASVASSTGWTDDSLNAVRQEHWSFRPVVRPPVPDVNETSWAINEIDRFLLSRMESSGILPAPKADARTLVRRLSFDLTGLPPSAEDVESFQRDPSAEAWGALIEKFLASPQYGEHWGRHWLDVARYADSSGKDENHACANAYQYRDYVVRSLNKDKPWNRFVMEQIAGDLLPAESEEQRFDAVAATGFLQMGQKALAEQDKEKMLLDIADEQLDTVSRGFMGLTITCARCHDHKFDPIRTQDYYGLAGIFRSTKTMENLAFVSTWVERPLASQTVIDDITVRTAALTEQLNQQKQLIEKLKSEQATSAEREQLAVVEANVRELEKSFPAPVPMAMAVDEGDIADLRIHIRGNHLNPGKLAPRGFPPVIHVQNVPVISDTSSGRLQLAQWLTEPDHPLTARVIVNRVWQWHFGNGLCRSSDNFGLRGERPDHPELLDWLTIQFVEDGWSLKNLHRRILWSQAWQMRSRSNIEGSGVDPENRLFSHFNRRRLRAEELRDSLLSVSGQLDLSDGGSLFNYGNREPHVTYYKGPVNYDFNRRTIYLPVVRSAMYDVLELFDMGGSLTSQPQRDSSTIAPQALFFMNSSFVLNASEQLAKQEAAQDAGQSDEESEFIKRVFRKVHQRLPTSDEMIQCQQLLEQVAESSVPARVVLCHAILMSHEFVYVD